jgi:hypothetical protein
MAFSESEKINRADFYDASGNHLMYVEFVYDSKGNNTERNVYMSDGVFKRRTVLINNSSGNREKEVSYDFNNDTSFVTTFGKDGDKTKFTVRDQFRVEQFGGDISYSGSGDNYDFFQKGSLINKMKYSGKRIEVMDKSGALAYYVELDNPPPLKILNRKILPSQMSVQQMRNNRFLIHLKLSMPSMVSCELISLSGKKVATLFSKRMVAGKIYESVNLSSVVPGLAGGVYMLDMSIDGKRIYRDKILVNSYGKGF